jgi:hypothetical protein
LVPLVALCLTLLLGACEGTRPLAALGHPGVLNPGPKEAAPTPDGQPPAGGDSSDDPARLRGMMAGEVMAKLGDPSYRRREAPAEVWQYFGPGCVLDVFLYEDKGTQRVTHVELRSRNLNPGAQAACLSQLLGGKRGDANS